LFRHFGENPAAETAEAGSLRTFRWLLPPLLLPLLAAGCAVPPVVTVASFAADGVSYAATGKSVTDHGISAATAHDCALLRPVLADKPVCDTTPGERGREIPVMQGQASVPRPDGVAQAQAEPATAKTRYVTVGSFLDFANAARMAARYADLHATIASAEVNGRHFYRVMVGPLSGEAAAALELRLAAL
jgi:hypothetical protein